MIRLRVYFVLLCALLPSFAFATNHTPGDQWGHFTFHFQQMLFWLGEGQWSLAFYQADCTQDAVSKLLFVHGGALWIALCITMLVTLSLRKQFALALRMPAQLLRIKSA